MTDLAIQRATLPFEERFFAVENVEIRDEQSGPVMHGYATTFNQPYTVRDKYGIFEETMKPTAFDRTLANRGDKIHLLVAHGGIPLAATHSRTLELTVDERGLKYSAGLDMRSPLAQTVASAVERRDMDEMSIGFQIPKGGDTWNAEQTERSINEAKLFELSVLPRGANPNTEAGMRAEDIVAEIRRLELILDVTPADSREIAMQAVEAKRTRYLEQLIQLHERRK